MRAHRVGSIVLLSALLMATPCVADDDDDEGRGYGKKCSPAGTWFGANSVDEEFVPAITRMPMP